MKRMALLVSLMVVGAVGWIAQPVGAGQPFQTIDVTKEIVGDPPPDAEFVVHVECVDGSSQPTASGTLEFDGPDTKTFDAGGSSITCTVTEDEDADAQSVEYECDAATAAECSDDNIVTFQSDVASAEVTVINTFPEAPPPEPPQALEVLPTFTG